MLEQADIEVDFLYLSLLTSEYGRNYGKTAQSKVKKSMEELKAGTLKSGSGKKVTNPKQAIAIGLSEARQSGAKVLRK
jgi:hypothetical protein